MEIDLYKGLVYTMPSLPPREKIQGWGLSEKDQKWRRTELPENWDDLSDEEREVFAFEEDRKCTEGHWFYVKGVATYITNDHYHYLNWFKIDSGYPDYRDRDRRWFYHWYLCDNDDNCLGQDYGKLRRDGFSYRVVSIILNRARKTFNAKYGILSKTGEDAKEMFNKLVHGFLEYPSFLKPQVQSAEDVKKSLVFKTPQQRVTFKNRGTKKEISLNTVIDWKNTKENAYDGTKLQILAPDEIGKWEEANAEKWFNIGKTCIILGGKIIGKMLFGSTVNESTKGGLAFKSIWDKSLHSERTANGRTLSGLWRYFVPAYDGLEGFIDEYGQSVMETPKNPVMGIDGNMIVVGAKEYLDNELKSKKDAGDMVGYYEQMRQFPRDEDEMFRDPTNESVAFDISKIYQQIDYNNETDLTRLIVRGNFYWQIKDKEVNWVPDPRGRWQIAWHPHSEKRNKIDMRFGKPSPGNQAEGSFGLDPFDHKKTTDNRKSNAASYGLRKFDPLNPQDTNIFISEYVGRPSLPESMYEDMIMQSVYYGWEILIENNKIGCIRYFCNRGYENYLMKRPAETQTEYSEKNQEEYGIPMTGEAARAALIETTQSYIYNNIGVNSETNKMGKCYFNHLLHDWSKFNPEKWTDYDATVGAGLAILGSRKYVPKKVQSKVINLFPKYSNRGNSSRLI